jgi:lysophospholipase L1-like esterase
MRLAWALSLAAITCGGGVESPPAEAQSKAPARRQCSSYTYRDIAVIGDSLQEKGNSTAEMSDLIVPLLRAKTLPACTVYGVFNMGASGHSSSDFSATYTNRVAAKGYHTVFIWGGINDFLTAGRTEAQAFSNFTTLFNTIRAAGLKLVIGSVLPCGRYVLCTADVITAIKALNADFATYQAAHTSDTCFVNLYSGYEDPQLADAALPSYVYDNLHPTLAGSTAMANAAASACFP